MLLFGWYRNNLVPEKSNETGPGKIWCRYRKIPRNLVPVPENSRKFSIFGVEPKKVQVLVPKYLVPEKVPVPVTEKIGPEKSTDTGTGKVWSQKELVPEKSTGTGTVTGTLTLCLYPKNPPRPHPLVGQQRKSPLESHILTHFSHHVVQRSGMTAVNLQRITSQSEAKNNK